MVNWIILMAFQGCHRSLLKKSCTQRLLAIFTKQLDKNMERSFQVLTHELAVSCQHLFHVKKAHMEFQIQENIVIRVVLRCRFSEVCVQGYCVLKSYLISLLFHSLITYENQDNRLAYFIIRNYTQQTHYVTQCPCPEIVTCLIILKMQVIISPHSQLHQ